MILKNEGSRLPRLALLAFAVAIAGFLGSAIALFTVFPYFLLVISAAKLFRHDLGPVITGLSAAFSVYPQPKSPVNLVHFIIMDGSIDRERLMSLFDERVIRCRDGRSGELKFPRFRDAYTEFMGYTFWKPEEKFYLEKHIREYDYCDKEELRLSSPCHAKDLQRVMGPLAAMGWRRDQSPWEFLLIHNYRLNDDGGQGDEKPRTVLLFRVHHTLIDGYGLVTFMRELFHCGYAVPAAMGLQRPVSVLARLLATLRMPWDMAKMYLDTHDGLPDWHVPPESPDRQLSAAISQPIPVSKVKEIKERLGVSYNAVIFAAIAGALRRYCKGEGIPVPRELGVYAPLPLPNHPGGTVNHAVIMGMRWKVALESHTERVSEMETVIRDVKASTIPLIGYLLAAGVGILPTFLRKAFFFRFFLSGGSVVISCFPSTNDAIDLDGLPCRDIISCVGAFGQPSMLVLITGINGNQHVVITADKRVFSTPRLEKISSYVEEEIDEMMKRRM